mmetsp:Transcript_139548/g.362836  ORF Transcript_139548/g.362836 Transcript_139548/m.362836 type:complete len:243 (-) Transcript_139548:38-766(-)
MTCASFFTTDVPTASPKMVPSKPRTVNRTIHCRPGAEAAASPPSHTHSILALFFMHCSLRIDTGCLLCCIFAFTVACPGGVLRGAITWGPTVLPGEIEPLNNPGVTKPDTVFWRFASGGPAELLRPPLMSALFTPSRNPLADNFRTTTLAALPCASFFVVAEPSECSMVPSGSGTWSLMVQLLQWPASAPWVSCFHVGRTLYFWQYKFKMLIGFAAIPRRQWRAGAKLVQGASTEQARQVTP